MVQEGLCNKQHTTNNKQQTTNNKQQTTSNKQQTTNNEDNTSNNKQQTTNNKRLCPVLLNRNLIFLANNKQQTTNSKQRASDYRFSCTFTLTCIFTYTCTCTCTCPGRHGHTVFLPTTAVANHIPCRTPPGKEATQCTSEEPNLSQLHDNSLGMSV